MSVSLSEIQVARSEGGSTSLAGLKMQLDIKKTQSLSLLPQFNNQAFILSPDLLNQINESRLMSSRVISDYMSRVDEALDSSLGSLQSDSVKTGSAEKAENEEVENPLDNPEESQSDVSDSEATTESLDLYA